MMLCEGYTRRTADPKRVRKSTKGAREKKPIREPAYITSLAQERVPPPPASPCRPPPTKSPTDCFTPHRHICPTCHRSFHWLCSLKRHLLSHGDDSDNHVEPVLPYTCDKCNANFESKTLLMRHINIAHGYPTETDFFEELYEHVGETYFEKAVEDSDDLSADSSSSSVDSGTEIRSGHSEKRGYFVYRVEEVFPMSPELAQVRRNLSERGPRQTQAKNSRDKSSEKMARVSR